MDGQPAFLILVLAIVALMQVQGHRPIVPAMPPSTYSFDDAAEVSSCGGIEFEIGCVRAWQLQPAASSARE